MRWLRIKGNLKEAETQLQKIAKRNGRTTNAILLCQLKLLQKHLIKIYLSHAQLS